MTYTRSRMVPQRTVVRVRRIPVLYIWISTFLLLGVNFYQINLLQKEREAKKEQAIKTEIQLEKDKLNATISERLVLDLSILDQPTRFYTGPGTTIVTQGGQDRLLHRENLTIPVHNDRSKVWPTRDSIVSDDDRVIAQLYYVPDLAKEYKKSGKSKMIYMSPDAVYETGVLLGAETFQEHGCLVDTCNITSDNDLTKTADAVVFIGTMPVPKRQRDVHHQVWIYYMLESPQNTYENSLSNKVNWTATYRRDSTLVAPYEKFVPFEDVKDLPKRANRNYAAGKTKMVAWFVSNCSPNNGRDEYAKELARHVEVDIYGSCGRKKCPKANETRCDSILSSTYKFYLSFENSNCQDYITEKFYTRGLNNDIVPIVMGARPETYAKVAPPGSYIHVDDFNTPRDLAHYLKILAEDDELYNEYFRWKGTGSFINTKFWCRLCSMLHDTSRLTWHRNLNDWWKPAGICERDWNWGDRFNTS